jgi:hypothetical protein
VGVAGERTASVVKRLFELYTSGRLGTASRKGEDGFLRYVTDMAKVFANATDAEDARYPNLSFPLDAAAFDERESPNRPYLPFLVG